MWSIRWTGGLYGIHASVAQMEEQALCKRQVVSSNLTIGFRPYPGSGVEANVFVAVVHSCVTWLFVI